MDPTAPALDPKVRKTTLRKISNGMYVVTSRDGSADGEGFGAATVTWLTQCSFTPPLVMAAIRPGSSVYNSMVASGAAAVHILDRTQQDIAQKFFTPTEVEDGRINGQPFEEGVTSSPILTSVRTYFECRVAQVVETGGDHVVFVLEVVAVHDEGDEEPLTVAATPWEYGG